MAYIRVLMAIPIVNFFVQFFLADPTYDSTNNLLSTLGLISALLLAVVFSLPGTVSRDELVAGDALYGFPNKGNPDANPSLMKWWGGKSMSPSYEFGKNISLSAWFLTVALLVVVVQYMFLGIGRTMAEGLPESKFMKIYHKYNRWVFVAVVAAIVVGCGTFFYAMAFMVVIKWPDYWIQEKTKGAAVYSPIFLLVIGVPIAVAAGAALAGQAQYELYVWACKEKQSISPGTTKESTDVQVQP